MRSDGLWAGGACPVAVPVTPWPEVLQCGHGRFGPWRTPNLGDGKLSPATKGDEPSMRPRPSGRGERHPVVQACAVLAQRLAFQCGHGLRAVEEHGRMAAISCTLNSHEARNFNACHGGPWSSRRRRPSLGAGPPIMAFNAATAFRAVEGHPALSENRGNSPLATAFELHVELQHLQAATASAAPMRPLSGRALTLASKLRGVLSHGEALQWPSAWRTALSATCTFPRTAGPALPMRPRPSGRGRNRGGDQACWPRTAFKAAR